MACISIASACSSARRGRWPRQCSSPSAACHDARELAEAERIGVDFVYLSPVLATTSHAGAETLGWPRLRALCTATRLPVYALGGMTPPQLPRAVRAGCL